MARFLWKIQSSFYHLLRRNPLSAFILRRENEGIRFLLKDLKAKSVLDIGCGRGNSLDLLSNFNAFLIAVDHASGMVHKNKKSYPGINFVTADAQFLPFRIDSFNLISCIGLFEYVKEWQVLLQEIDCLLRAGDHAIITLSPPSLLNWLRLILGHRIFSGTEAKLSDYLSATSLKVIQRNKTLIQLQFLLKKEEVVPADGISPKKTR